MPAAASSPQFLSMVRSSGLLPIERLNRYVAEVPGVEQIPPEDLAEQMIRDGLLTEFQAKHLVKGRYKNFFIGNFKVLEALGRGGMSQVFLAEHTLMKHQVALKLLLLKDTADAAAVERFRCEARAAGAVNHPNVVRAHDVGRAGRIHYLVMDYVDGVNLHELVRRLGPLPPEPAAHYIAQAALGLQEIADRGLIHRDIKPANLLLDRHGVVRILDLGLACFAVEQAAFLAMNPSQADQVFGTADYLSPEQAAQPGRLDARGDIYGLGASLYYLLAGHPPFVVTTTAQKLMAHQFAEPEPIPDVPPALFQVVRKMMQKKPEDRYQQAIEVVEALAPWSRLPLPAPPPNYFSESPTAQGDASTSTQGNVQTTPGGSSPTPSTTPHHSPSDIFRATGRLFESSRQKLAGFRHKNLLLPAAGIVLAALAGLIAGALGY